VDQFAAFVKDSSYKTDAEKADWSIGFEIKDGTFDVKKTVRSWREPSFDQKGDYPVVQVSWNDAKAFCDWLSKKSGKTVVLPTEAQWEYACRAGSKTRFSFGDSDKGIANYAWHAANATGTPHPVGQKKPNAWGLYDMHGNVWEWCADWYGPSSKEGAADPQGPASGDQRVLRGGAWVSNPIACRAAYRVGQAPGFRYYFIGFRVAMPAAAVDAK